MTGLSTSSFSALSGKGLRLQEHALLRNSPFAEVAPFGWKPKEPGVKAHWSNAGAGAISAGCIDNTYLPFPLSNAWGKCRSLAVRERRKLPHKQATDLLVTCKGYKVPPPAAKQMESVQESYAKTIPLVHPIDPQRMEAGFLNGPNSIPGAKPPPVSPLHSAPPVQSVTPDWRMKKMLYEQNMATHGSRVIPVHRKVGVPTRPSTAQPRFMYTPAGLPGGLALIKVA